MKKVFLLIFIVFFLFSGIIAQDSNDWLKYFLKDYKIISDDGKYLGKIGSPFDPDSILNPFGKYGSQFSSDSINNQFGKYGGKFSLYSPYNPYTQKPPKVYSDKEFIGYLTVNPVIFNKVNPYTFDTENIFPKPNPYQHNEDGFHSIVPSKVIQIKEQPSVFGVVLLPSIKRIKFEPGHFNLKTIQRYKENLDKLSEKEGWRSSKKKKKKKKKSGGE